MTKLFPFLLLAFAACSMPAQAIPEQGFEPRYHSEVLPFFENQAVNGFFSGQQSALIHYAYLKNPQAKGAVVISNGFTENTTEYAENAFDLYAQGYSVFLLDHRGQGQSGRLIADENLAYIDDFQYFVDDLKTFVDSTVKPQASGLPLYLWGHSLGGAIGARYTELYPSDFRALVLSSPMLSIQLPDGWTPLTAKAMLLSLHNLGRGKDMVFGQKRVDPRGTPFYANTITHSQARYAAYVEASGIRSQSILYAPTNDWVLQALTGAEATMANARAAALPILLLQAGEDSFVENPSENAFCAAASLCEIAAFPEARHEIMMESDSTRDAAFQRMLAFFSAHP